MKLSRKTVKIIKEENKNTLVCFVASGHQVNILRVDELMAIICAIFVFDSEEEYLRNSIQTKILTKSLYLRL